MKFKDVINYEIYPPLNCQTFFENLMEISIFRDYDTGYFEDDFFPSDCRILNFYDSEKKEFIFKKEKEEKEIDFERQHILINITYKTDGEDICENAFEKEENCVIFAFFLYKVIGEKFCRYGFNLESFVMHKNQENGEGIQASHYHFLFSCENLDEKFLDDLSSYIKEYQNEQAAEEEETAENEDNE